MEEHVTLALPLLTVTVPVGTQDPTANIVVEHVTHLVKTGAPALLVRASVLMGTMDLTANTLPSITSVPHLVKMEGRVAVTVCVTALLVMVDRTASIHPSQVAGEVQVLW